MGMKTIPVLAAALALCTPARAINMGKPAPSPWAAPVARTVMQEGTVRFAKLGPGFTDFLAGKAETLPKFLADNPGTLDRLGVQLAAHGHTPASLAALPAEQRAEALRAAAAAAEKAVAVEAQTFIASAAGAELTGANAAQLLETAERLFSADVMYGRGAHMDKLSGIAERVVRFKRKRREAFEAKLAAIPGMVDSGKFDNGLIVPGVDGKFEFADDPTAEFATAKEAFQARLAAVNAMPDGYWKSELYQKLSRSTDESQPGGRLLAAEGVEPRKIREQVQRAWEDWARVVMEPGDPAQRAARQAHAKAAYENKVPGPAHVAASLRHYDTVVAWTSQHRFDRDWIAKNILEGKALAGFPSYEQLKEWQRGHVRKASRMIAGGVAAAIAGAVGMFSVGDTSHPFLYGWTSFGVVLAGIALFLVGQRLRMLFADTYWADRTATFLNAYQARVDATLASGHGTWAIKLARNLGKSRSGGRIIAE